MPGLYSSESSDKAGITIIFILQGRTLLLLFLSMIYFSIY